MGRSAQRAPVAVAAASVTGYPRAVGAGRSSARARRRDGELRARQELSRDVLRQVTSAAKGKRDADTEIRARHQPRRRARTLTPRDRRRRPGVARHRPRDPSPTRRLARTTSEQTSRSPWTANRGSSPHSRGPSPTSRPHPGPRPRARHAQRPAQFLCTQVLALRQPLAQVIAIRATPARSTMLPRTPAAFRSAAIRAVARRRRSRAPPTPAGQRTAAPTPAPRRHRPAPRSRAARASGLDHVRRPLHKNNPCGRFRAGAGDQPQPRASRRQHLRRMVMARRIPQDSAQPADRIEDRNDHPPALPPEPEVEQGGARSHAPLLWPQDRDPSCSVNVESGAWRCWGCGAAGADRAEPPRWSAEARWRSRCTRGLDHQHSRGVSKPTDRRKSATLISGTGFQHGRPLHASRAVGASHIGL